ncbi:SdrD B-like domain-containing protein [Methylobacillus sp. Pita1]|uniref:SdrD B-like domain-containing protein n=1 Tax=Methylobacillus sp. Pita1 TaxID=3382642 RepID=UPI0038B47EEE
MTVCRWLGGLVRTIGEDRKAIAQRVLFAVLGMMALPALANVDVLIPTMTNSPNPAIRGGDVTYSITVNNDGSEAATGVQVRIDIPAGTTNPRASLGGDPAVCSVDAGGAFALCTLATLAAQSSVTAQLIVEAGAATPATITIGASVSATNESPNTGANNALSRNTTVNDGADIYLSSVTGSPNPVVGGGNITWSLAGGNNGPSDASNPRIVVTLPDSLQFVSGSGGDFNCSASGQEVTCTRVSAIPASGSFAGLALVTKVIDVTSGNVIITPRISSSLDDPDVNNNQLPAAPPVAISAGADLQITQTSPISVAVSEQEVTFNLAATNNGPSDATNGVTVTYTLPAGFDYVSAIPTGPNWQACTTSGSSATGITITCNNPDNFAAGRNDPIEIRVRAPEATTQITSYDLTAGIAHNAGNPDDPIPANNQSVLPLQVGPDGAGLSISKTRNPNPVAEGQLINSVLRVTNQGPTPVAAANPGTVQVTDTINLADEEFVSYSGTGWTCDNVTSGNNLDSAVSTVTCTYSQALATSGSGATSNPLTIVTRSKVKGVAYDATNNAEVACSVGAKCWYPVKTTSSTAAVTQESNSIDLSITKAVATPGGVNERLESNESTMTYTLVVRNNTATVDAENVVVRDPLPRWLSGTVLPAMSSIPSVNNAGGGDATFSCAIVETSVLQCTQAAGTKLRAGDIATFTIPVGRPLQAGAYTNTATVSSSSQGDLNTANNSASVSGTIDPIADVEMVSKIPTPATPQAGTDVSYVLTFRNNGPSPAQNVTVSDNFVVGPNDPGFTVLAINPVNWTSGTPNCSGLVVGQSYGAGSSATLTCQGGQLNNGEQRTVTVLVRPNWKSGQGAGDTWSISNTASITTTTAENVDGTDGGNNSKSATVTVAAADIDMLVEISDNVDPLGYDASNNGDNPQNDVIYAVRLHNNGPSLATGVQFTYELTPKTGKTLRFLGDSPVAGAPSGSICNNVGQTVTGPATLLITCTYVGEDAKLVSGVDLRRYLSVRMLTEPESSGDVHPSKVTVRANETDRNLLNNSETETTTVRNDIPVNNLSVSGRVYVDVNDDGLLGAGEVGIGGVTITLTGTSSDGTPVSRTIQTAPDGSYTFAGLPPSNDAGYTIVQTQPAGYTDGKDQVGSLGTQSGISPGIVLPAGTDSFTVVLTNQSGTGYNFGEVPAGTLGSISGHVWLDGNHDRVFNSVSPDATDRPQANWDVELWRDGVRVATARTDTNGAYSFTNLPLGSGYQVRFLNPNGQLAGHARPNEQGLSYVNGQVSPANPAGASNLDGGLSNITLTAGTPNITQHSLPIDPAGVVYDAVTRLPVAGAVVTIRGPAGFTPASDLVGGNVSQTTGVDGIYQFLLNASAPAGVYTLEITSYPANYIPQPSSMIPVCNATLNVASVLAGGADPAMMQQNDAAPAVGVGPHDPAACSTSSSDGSFNNGSGALAAAMTRYYFNFTIGPESADVINNHIPLDPVMGGIIRIVKTTPLVNVVRGDLVPYTVTATSSVAINNITITDRLPPGFKYRTGSASVNGVRIEPEVNGRDLAWANQTFSAGETKTFKLILVVGTGVGEGEYTNQAWAENALVSTLVSNIGSATVKVTPDPTFDCSDIIGKVFDDKNANGYQDQGEPGIPNARVVTARGLLVTTDAEGRFHVTCADIPNMDRGANFVMKLDERTLPSGYRVTTENPRDVRVTRGKMVKLNFGATVHRVVRLDLNDQAFVPDGIDLQPQWQEAFADMVKQLDGRPSVLRVAYDPGGGGEKLAKKRLDGVAKAARKLWKETHTNNKDEAAFPLIIETAVEVQP